MLRRFVEYMCSYAPTFRRLSALLVCCDISETICAVILRSFSGLSASTFRRLSVLLLSGVVLRYFCVPRSEDRLWWRFLCLLQFVLVLPGHSLRSVTEYLTWHKASASSVTAHRSLYTRSFQSDVMYISVKVVRTFRLSAVLMNNNAQYFLRRTKNEILHTDIRSVVNVKHI